MYVSTLLAFIAMGCGAQNDERDTSTSSKASTPTQDNASAASVAFNVVDEATDAIHDDSNASAIALLADSERSITRTKSCSVSDGVATVLITLSGSGSTTITKAKMSATLSMTASGTETRVWTPPTGQSLECNSEQTAAKINWKNDSLVDGLKTEITVDKQRNISKSITTAKKTFTASDNATVKGTRTVSWAKESSTTALVRTKTITSEIVRSKTSTDKDGTKTSITSTITTKEADPMVVSVERSLTTKALTKKTIRSGTLVATEDDGVKTESSFSSVVYDLSSSNENKCQPISGSITGKIFEKDATTPAKTFTITFGDSTVDSGVSISYDGAEAEDYPDYNSKGCELEQES